MFEPLAFLHARIEHTYRSNQADNPIRQHLEAALASDIPSLADTLTNIPANHIQPLCNAIQVHPPLFNRIIRQLQLTAAEEAQINSDLTALRSVTTNAQGHTTLHRAVQHQCVPLIQRLLERDLKECRDIINISNRATHTPLYLALSQRNLTHTTIDPVLQCISDHVAAHPDEEYPIRPESRIILAYIRGEPNILQRIIDATNRIIREEDSLYKPVRMLQRCAQLFRSAYNNAAYTYLNRYAEKVQYELSAFKACNQAFLEYYIKAIYKSTPKPRVHLPYLFGPNSSLPIITQMHTSVIHTDDATLNEAKNQLESIAFKVRTLTHKHESVSQRKDYAGVVARCISRVLKTRDAELMSTIIQQRLIWLVEEIKLLMDIHASENVSSTLTNVIAELNDGGFRGQECPNKALDALNNAESQLIKWRLRDNHKALFERIFLEARREWLNLYICGHGCMQSANGKDLSATLGAEIGLMNQMRFNRFLKLGLCIEELLYVDNFIERGSLTERNFPKPEGLFRRFFKEQTPTRLIKQLIRPDYQPESAPQPSRYIEDINRIHSLLNNMLNALSNTANDVVNSSAAKRSAALQQPRQRLIQFLEPYSQPPTQTICDALNPSLTTIIRQIDSLVNHYATDTEDQLYDPAPTIELTPIEQDLYGTTVKVNTITLETTLKDSLIALHEQYQRLIQAHVTLPLETALTEELVRLNLLTHDDIEHEYFPIEVHIRPNPDGVPAELTQTA